MPLLSQPLEGPLLPDGLEDRETVVSDGRLAIPLGLLRNELDLVEWSDWTISVCLVGRVFCPSTTRVVFFANHIFYV